MLHRGTLSGHQGGQGVVPYSWNAPKDFLIKIPEPTGFTPTLYVGLTTDLISAQGKTPTEWTIGGALDYDLLDV